MTATMNTGAETIRLDKNYMPLLLQLKTTGAVGIDDATESALRRLEAGDLVRDGELHPMADAMLEIVAAPALVINAERMRLGAIAASTIWATPAGAAVGTRVDGGLYELKLASTALLPFYLYQMIHLRPLSSSADFRVTVGAEPMLSAESRLMQADRAAAIRGLLESGLSSRDAHSVVQVLEARIASWRIHSIWSAGESPMSHEAHGMDCGELGHILATIGDAEPSLTLRTAEFGEVLANVRAALPR